MNPHLPNILTVVRILLTPLFVYILFWGGENGYPWALAVFITAGITDIIDGRLARRYQLESTLGKMLDPLADKILVLSALISFVNMELIYAWMVALIVLRDLVVTAIRYLLEKSDSPMATSNLAKGKTAVQVASVIFILGYLSMRAYHVDWIITLVERSHIVLVFMYLTVLFTLYTGFDYIMVNRAGLRALARSNSQ